MHSFNVNLYTDSVDNDREGYTTAEPMGLTLAIVVSGSFQSVNGPEISSGTVPDSEYYPPPEDFEVEELALLASLIDHRVLEHELIVDILNIELE